MDRPNIWSLGAFCGCFADAFVQGNSQVPKNDLGTSIAVLELLFHGSEKLQNKFTNESLFRNLKFCRELLQEQIDNVEKFAKFIDNFMVILENLKEGDTMFIPAGWIGMTTQSSFVLIAEALPQSRYRLVVCNAGIGINYHPNRVCEMNAKKVTYLTCLPIDDIPKERFLDRVFWTSSFAQFLKPGEFNRVEVFYDVLLPWLSGEHTLTEIVEKYSTTDTEKLEYRTPMRSDSSSAWRNLMEAVRYFLMKYCGYSRGEMKLFQLTVRCEMLNMAFGDLKDLSRDKPTDDERIMIQLACRSIAHATLKHKAYIPEKDLFVITQLLSEVKHELEQHSENTAIKPFTTPGLVLGDSSFRQVDIGMQDVEHYAGAAEEPKATEISDILKVGSDRVTTIEDIVATMVNCQTLCSELNQKISDGSSFSSRVALQYQIVELIGNVFTRVVPLPKPLGETCIYQSVPSKQLQLTTLTLVYQLLLQYSEAWQSIEYPSRAFDSERAIVALCMLTIYDATLRRNDLGMHSSSILHEDGGFAISTNMCVASLPLERIVSVMEVQRPHFAEARGTCMNYLVSMQHCCKYKDLFDFRMPTDKIELKKYSSTVLFLRKMMERCGFELVPRDNTEPPPEIESLMEWLTSPSTALAEQHPEFGMLRDVVCLTKFLVTMESRESELQRQRIAPSEYVSWGLSFEDNDSSTSAFRGRFHMRSYRGLRWEVLNYRGADLDTADIQVTSFGNRKIFFGEGPLVHSPCDVRALLNKNADSDLSEDDIMHAEKLPNYSDTLSRHESEVLFSYLTVPYIRIPLVVSFFANSDRVTYLFNVELQNLLRAVLFEAAEWAPNNQTDWIASIPVTRTNLHDALRLGGGRPTKPVKLCTPYGLLINELTHAADGTLSHFLKMFNTVNDLSQASVYSPDTALCLFLIELAVDVQSFFKITNVSDYYIREFHEILTVKCRSYLVRWIQEATENGDIETCCVLRSYLVILWFNIDPSQYDADNVGEILGSICFVRNWHRFGQNEHPYLAASECSETQFSPEQRLLRFMQAHGVDTAEIVKGSLQKYIGQKRPLYLRIGAKTVRVPNINGTEDDGLVKRHLAASVLEHKVMAMLHDHRPHLVRFFESLDAGEEAQKALSFMMNYISDTAVNISKDSTIESRKQAAFQQTDTGLRWSRCDRGYYKSPDEETALDIQTAHVLWRNDELKPLPDSMVQFNDFHTIFGNQHHHCGVVANQHHRQWVHVVGTPYDLQLWDAPDNEDQGIGFPEEVQERSATTTVSRWACGICTYMNSPQSELCEMCESPKPGAGQRPPQAANQREVSSIRYRGVIFDRVLDPFSKETMEKFTEDDQWFLAIILPALQAHYKEKLPFKLFTPSTIENTADEVVSWACVKTEHEVEDRTRGHGRRMFGEPTVRKIVVSTWKQFVCCRSLKQLTVFNMISHGRRMYRQLIYASDAKTALHSLPPSSAVFGACGDVKALTENESSLVITRNLGDQTEMFLPSRLLFGVIPSALLEAYQFWHGADNVIRGEPLDLESQWFGNSVIEIDENRHITRKPYVQRKRVYGRTQRRLVVGEAANTMSTQQTFDENDILNLCALGFTPEAVRLALSKCDGNAAFAAEWLLDPDHSAQIFEAETTGFVDLNEEYKVVYHGAVEIHRMPAEESDDFASHSLGTLRFGEVVTVLQHAGNWVRIKRPVNEPSESWILESHPLHGKYIERITSSASPSQKLTSNNVSQVLKQVQHISEQCSIETKTQSIASNSSSQMQNRLVNCLDAPSGKLLTLLMILVRIEDASHILIWQDQDLKGIQEIVIPRLKLRIVPEEDMLNVTEQAGWYVVESIPDSLCALLDAHSILLQSNMQELQFLIPNHDVSRPAMKGKPFSKAIRCDRGSFAWQQTMDTRYFLYPIHTSKTFLVSRELGASIYLVLLKLLYRDYESCFNLATTCTVDVHMSPDEHYIWNQLAQANDDRHPDAHACRLKLTLAVMYAKNHLKLPWETHRELDAYIDKESRVSSSCRLTLDEIKKLCTLVTQGTSLIRNASIVLNAERHPKELKGPTTRIGGAPWNKLQRQSLKYFNDFGVSLKRVQMRSDGFDNLNAFLTEVIYAGHLINDEESGATRQLGFMFLVVLLRSGDLVRTGVSTMSPLSAGSILSRYMHLKMSRWGKESVGEGEIESSSSRHMAQLAAIIARPSENWPAIPQDSESSRLVKNGLNLYSETGRRSMVKAWLDILDAQFQEIWPSLCMQANSHFRLVSPPIASMLHPEFIMGRPRANITSTENGHHEAVCQDIMQSPLKMVITKNIRYGNTCVNKPATSLPFDLSQHSAAQNQVAQDLIHRLEEDVRTFSKITAETLDPELVDTSDDILDELLRDLNKMEQDDRLFIEREISEIECKANDIRTENIHVVLESFANQQQRISFDMLTQSLLSTATIQELRQLNPSVSEDQWGDILCRIAPILLKSNRISQIGRCSYLAKALRRVQNKESRAQHQYAKSLAEALATQRHYLNADGTFDPRYLVFEYVFDIVLRKRQIEIVQSFMHDMENGKSHVQQMIMGAGKTTVVAPLLTLLLANGETLVTHVMPTALLEQTRQIVRSRFGAIISKQVFTFQFDRSCQDNPDTVKEVFAKLHDAKVSRAVICASPDSIKSLYLKFIELLHSVESVDPSVVAPTSSVRHNREAVKLRDSMFNRSQMADALIPIFDIWKTGVLIMDEVDVLLHPLRSELNFPIGLKNPIDMSGVRWSLPTYLLRPFFPNVVGKPSEGLETEIWNEIHFAMERGYSLHALQRNPHLVLLDGVFYQDSLMKPMAKWCTLWILQQTTIFTSADLVVEYLTLGDVHDCPQVFRGMQGEHMKLLNLARDWIRVLLPHCLSKIDRVSFGLLSTSDLVNVDPSMPQSRKLMAVPFVGKDVPSRSSEFAHPDVVIGLTLLAFHYEGLRISDVRAIVTQLKADFTRQVGPRNMRPSSVLFRKWLSDYATATGQPESDIPVLPLPLFQVNDANQLKTLHKVLSKIDSVIEYYLHQHVFPACMNFQSIKISACGHELGSSILFEKRIGFSGTPSNLLPQDLGECTYEPGSDGLVIHVLSAPDVVSIEKKQFWTARNLLDDIATSPFPVHALLDTGALITGMDNEEVARYLMERLPHHFEGVVYIDRFDRKMILQRSSGRSLHLSQCGISPANRFTFYDQVHTTGMDIVQASDACAVITLGKDMTFRDYAQGTFRMRGIGKGQKIHVFLIPEVEHLISHELHLKSENYICTPLDIMAWLLVNTMKMESIQFTMLSIQELFNTWRKNALLSLQNDSRSINWESISHQDILQKRLRRFIGDANINANWLRKCLNLYREPVGFLVPDTILLGESLEHKVRTLANENMEFFQGSLIEKIIGRLRGIKSYNQGRNLETEIVNENEKEQHEENEEEAEEQQEKISQFVRDDEQHNPWSVFCLNRLPSAMKSGDHPFYAAQKFQVRDSQPKLPYPKDMMVSDNWFRPQWIGLGERRLKNVMVILEWQPESFSHRIGAVTSRVANLCRNEPGNISRKVDMIRALGVSIMPSTDQEREWVHGACATDSAHINKNHSIFRVAITLAEAETLRRVMHTPQVYSLGNYTLTSVESGDRIETTPLWVDSNDDHGRETALACFRFLNSEMYFTENLLERLLEAFNKAPVLDRIHHYEDCLRLRRREKFLWANTPLAKLFTAEEDWSQIETRALLQQISDKLRSILRAKRCAIDLVAQFAASDSNNDGLLSSANLQKLLEDLSIGFAPADIALVVGLIFTKHESLSLENVLEIFQIPPELANRNEMDENAGRVVHERWQCANCTFLNLASDLSCEVCGCGWNGEIHVPSDKWMCDPVFGGCTFFNPQGNFYCEICNKCKPSLRSMRF